MKRSSGSKYALALKEDLTDKVDLIPLDKDDTDLSAGDLVIIKHHLQGWTAGKIAKELDRSLSGVHKVLSKPDAKELIKKNRDYVYDELQALGEQVIGVLREGLVSENQGTRIKCALGLVGRLAKPKDEHSVDDRLTATKFLQQININNLQVLKKEDTETLEPNDIREIKDVASDVRIN